MSAKRPNTKPTRKKTSGAVTGARKIVVLSLAAAALALALGMVQHFTRTLTAPEASRAPPPTAQQQLERVTVRADEPLPDAVSRALAATEDPEARWELVRQLSCRLFRLRDWSGTCDRPHFERTA